MESTSGELQREAQALADALAVLYEDSPLAEVGARLIDSLEGVAHAVAAGQPARTLAQVIAAARRIRDSLPQSFGDRFYFDASIIQAVRKRWSGDAMFSDFCVPRYERGWGFYKVPMPSEDRAVGHTVRVITFPGSDRLADVDLSDYAWLLHELAHDAFFTSRCFMEAFSKRLIHRLRTLKLRASADRGSAASRGTEHIANLEHHWTPLLTQQDWAHEIAVDVVAFWSLGPAFTLCFRRLMDSGTVNVLSATDYHPPYLTRAQALLQAAERLGWSDEVWALREQIRLGSEEGDSDLLVYGDPEILDAVVEESCLACERLNIPRMTQVEFNIMQRAASTGAVVPFGTDTIVLGGLQKTRLTSSEYAEWMGRLIKSAVAE
jgi:hypothetical protein